MTLSHHMRVFDCASCVLIIALLCVVTQRSEAFVPSLQRSDAFGPMYNSLGHATHAPRQFTHISMTTNTESKIKIGTLAVSPMGMGTLNWPLNKETDQAAEDSLRACYAAGINFIDTAEAYGFGTSEKLTRNCVSAVTQPFWVATKFAPVPWRRDSEDVVNACKASADRLGVEAIDLYQIHWPDIIQPLKAFGVEEVKDEKYWDGIAKCYNMGLIKNVGVSNYGPKLLAKAHAALAARGVPLASNQINYSLLYRKSGSQATVDKCKELGIQPIGYFPLANGLLAGKYTAAGPGGLKGLTMKKYLQGGVTEGGITYPPDGVSPKKKYHYFLCMKQIVDGVFQCYNFAAFFLPPHHK